MELDKEALGLEPHEVVLRCKVCGEPIMRSRMTGEWTHLDEFVVAKPGEGTSPFFTLVQTIGEDNHKAVPDVIDI